MLTLTKLEIAEHQLKKALELFLVDSDYVSAITLAGAAEEILGKLRAASGEEHALGTFINGCTGVGRAVFSEDWQPSIFAEIANHYRNGLKHITDSSPMTIPRSAAVEILDRAIENYWALTGNELPEIKYFVREEHHI